VVLKFDDSVVVSLLRYFLWALSITDVFKFKILEHQRWIMSKENTLKILNLKTLIIDSQRKYLNTRESVCYLRFLRISVFLILNNVSKLH
jgi:hypothetical protein